jgi:hypothetical protein
MVLHSAPAAIVAGEKATGLLGRITEFRREGKELGHLLDYAEKWNRADVSPATRGVGKDRQPIIDPAGQRNTEEHFMRLKYAVKEFDNAWYDATSNVVVSFTNTCNFLLSPVSLFPDSHVYTPSPRVLGLERSFERKTSLKLFSKPASFLQLFT